MMGMTLKGRGCCHGHVHHKLAAGLQPIELLAESKRGRDMKWRERLLLGRRRNP